MPVSFSVKNVPDDIAERLRERAARNHRSLQGELMNILAAAAGEEAEVRPLTPKEVLAEVRALGVSSRSESSAMIRADRDAR